MIPDLPAGQFFHAQYGGFGMVRVTLREKRRFFGSRVLESTYIYPSDYADAPSALLYAYGRLSEYRAETLKHAINLDAILNYEEGKS